MTAAAAMAMTMTKKDLLRRTAEVRQGVLEMLTPVGIRETAPGDSWAFMYSHVVPETMIGPVFISLPDPEREAKYLSESSSTRSDVERSAGFVYLTLRAGDRDRACSVLNPSRRLGHRLNPYSGKWNLPLSAPGNGVLTAAEILDGFRRHIGQVVDLPGKDT